MPQLHSLIGSNTILDIHVTRLYKLSETSDFAGLQTLFYAFGNDLTACDLLQVVSP